MRSVTNKHTFLLNKNRTTRLCGGNIWSYIKNMLNIGYMKYFKN